MSVPLWAAELARAFWQEAGDAEPFPRGLRRPILRAFDLSVVPLPRLRLFGALEWLRRHEIEVPLAEADRPLRAGLVCALGAGFLFLDAEDDEAEQRFSLAHELAHFLRDYWRPRRLAAERLGVRILEVFDGRRPPDPTERLHALLRRTPLGFYVHLLRRDADGRPDAAAAVAEKAADLLAWELLAPADVVLDGQGGGREALAARLRGVFGLPPAQAADYAAVLRPARRVEPFLLRLRNFR